MKKIERGLNHPEMMKGGNVIEVIKNRIWDLLKEKDVSLVMIYDTGGNILWHRGRPITDKNVRKGRGFSMPTAG